MLHTAWSSGMGGFGVGIGFHGVCFSFLFPSSFTSSWCFFFLSFFLLFLLYLPSTLVLRPIIVYYQEGEEGGARRTHCILETDGLGWGAVTGQQRREIILFRTTHLCLPCILPVCNPTAMSSALKFFHRSRTSTCFFFFFFSLTFSSPPARVVSRVRRKKKINISNDR